MAVKKSEIYSSLWKSCDELRGGMDASQYKDYVLVLLFVKYVSDKYAGDPNALIDVPKGGSFADMVALRGDKEIGDKINKIIARLAEANDLKGVIDVADFNAADKLGGGKEMVDRLSNLVAIFNRAELDFRKNRAEGDDILGDAYEYLMRHFATESGKSKGQFYTPAEVSRIMAKVIGVRLAKSADQTIYDPTCGSGSMANGDIYVFVDECHRTQSGKLREAMESILPGAMFIGFTGTPLLKDDKKTSIEIFGPYIHTYKFDEAVTDGVVLDLRYEARDVDQNIASPARIDQWFEAKTKGLTDLAKAQLKQRWGTMRKVLSSQSRLEKVVADILLDMETRDRLKSGRGNAMLVSSSIYQACKLYEIVDKTDLAGNCAIVTSYKPSPNDIKGESSGEGLTERLRQYEIYNKMLNGEDAEKFEKDTKKKFVEEPGQMKLLIVVDKLLTGFDAPSATYLYIDKQMRDHGLFQAICRVNRLDGEDKEYGYIIDYKDLFKCLETSIHDYTSGALDRYAKEDVTGLLSNRLEKARQRLEGAREAIKALCEPVEPPQDTPAYIRFFCARDTSDRAALKENEPKRLTLYKLAASLVRAYADTANELTETGYTDAEIRTIKAEVEHFEKVRNEVKLASGDYIDLKMHEPAMRHLIDTYIRAEDSEIISAFDDTSLIQLIVERGADAVKALPKGIRESKEAVAETIENNVRKLIIDETPINPKYYETMSELLDALIEQRKQQALDYEKYLAEIVALTRKVNNPAAGATYPATIDTAAKRALYDNLGKNEGLATVIDADIRKTKKDDWRGNKFKEKEVRNAIRKHLSDDGLIELIFDLVRNQHEY